jgi:hypothetical protein
MADGLITTQGSKTRSALYRHIVGDSCPKSAADTFREAPWQAEAVCPALRQYLVQTTFVIADCGSWCRPESPFGPPTRAPRIRLHFRFEPPQLNLCELLVHPYHFHQLAQAGPLPIHQDAVAI